MSSPSCAHDHRQTFPAVELKKHRGKWVAFALDGSAILASGDSELDLAEKAEACGLKPADYVMEPIPEEDTLIHSLTLLFSVSGRKSNCFLMACCLPNCPFNWHEIGQAWAKATGYSTSSSSAMVSVARRPGRSSQTPCAC
jgi:hypothetical protein